MNCEQTGKAFGHGNFLVRGRVREGVREGGERRREWMRRVDSRSESIWRVSVTYIVDALIHSL